MTYSISLNLLKVNEWGLGLNAAVVMGIFADLESWADKCRSAEPNDGDFYYTLYHNKILSELPFLGSRSTVVRAVKELEEKGLIKSINKHSTPAYALTDKGLGWKKIIPIEEAAPDQPNVGESSADGAAKDPKPKKERKRHSFSLPSKCLIDECDEEYMNRLREAAYAKCDKDGIPREEYASFVRWYMKHTTKYRNWLATFGDWCDRYEKRQKAQQHGVDFTGKNGGLC